MMTDLVQATNLFLSKGEKGCSVSVTTMDWATILTNLTYLAYCKMTEKNDIRQGFEKVHYSLYI